MARLDFVNLRIAALETRLTAAGSMVKTVGSGGTSVTYEDTKALTEELSRLYVEKGRLDGSSPMFVSTTVKGRR